MHESNRQRHRRQRQPLAPHQDFREPKNDRQRYEWAAQAPEADQHDNDADRDQDIVKSPDEPRLFAVFGGAGIERRIVPVGGSIRCHRPEADATVSEIGFEIAHLTGRDDPFFGSACERPVQFGHEHSSIKSRSIHP